jgi:phage shock protein PspC (stress-responsive transcriptional regulator)
MLIYAHLIDFAFVRCKVEKDYLIRLPKTFKTDRSVVRILIEVFFGRFRLFPKYIYTNINAYKETNPQEHGIANYFDWDCFFKYGII